jgi:phosphoribosylaminoimidazolecarboxamide formyltransferase/IMP cyclohydrolase
MNDGIVPIRRALVTVYDKRQLVELARSLTATGAEILASGGTQSALAAAGVAAIEVAGYTDQAEVLGGRVKTLHPKIFGGILARRDVPDDMETLKRHEFPPIDLVVVNLYPFEATIARPGCSLAEAVENIDIGGPSLIRAAAKNHAHVAVVTAPEQYDGLIAAIRNQGGTSLEERRRFAAEAFRRTAQYDKAIAGYLEDAMQQPESHAGPEGLKASRTQRLTLGKDAPEFPAVLNLRFDLRQSLRYGENPHQKAAFYVEPAARGPNLAVARVVHGKELSFNNLLDLDCALRTVRSFAEPAACILKHNNPCGAAIDPDPAVAFEHAYEGDPVSAYGGVVGLNRPVSRAVAERMCQPGRFLEAILAPGFAEDALELIRTRPSWRASVRLIDVGAPIGPSGSAPPGLDYRRVEGGLLVQSWDELEHDPAAGTVPTKRLPTDAERRDLAFAWRVSAAVKSNAIVLARDRQVVGVGAGQMSRLDSVRIAVEKAGPRAKGAVLASDAFFPFRDGPDLAAAAGVVAIIQPGGSKRDDETLAACAEHGMAMILTGRRHFRH